MATKGIPSVPDVPSQLTEDDIYRILEPLKRIIDIRQGQFDPLDRWVTQQDLIDAGLQTEAAVTSPVTVIPSTQQYQVTLQGDVAAGPDLFGTGNPVVVDTIIDLPAVVCIDGGAADSTYTGQTTGPYGATGNFEPALGNPAADGYVLSSTTGGVRSWIELTTGGLLSEDANNNILGGGQNAWISGTLPGSAVNNILIGSGSGVDSTFVGASDNIIIATNSFTGVSNIVDIGQCIFIGNNMATNGLVDDVKDVIAIGFRTLEDITGIDASIETTIVGNYAGADITSGQDNAFFGSYAGRNVTTGSTNAFFGRRAGQNFDGDSDGNVAIGNFAGPSSLSVENNQLYINNANGTPLIGGDFGLGTVTINGDLTVTGTLTGGGGGIGGSIADNQIAVGAVTANEIEGTTGGAGAFEWDGTDMIIGGDVINAIYKSGNFGRLKIAAGDSEDAGANIYMYGPNVAGAAYNFQIRTGTVPFLDWDNGAGTLQLFGSNSLITKNLALTINSDGTSTFAGTLNTRASDSFNAAMIMPQGSAPTTPSNGMVWSTSAGMFIRAGGTTIGPFIDDQPASFTVPPLGSDPGTPGEGDLWQNTTSDDVKVQLNGTTEILATQSWVTANAGGGTIGGSITDNQIAVGATTADDIEGSSSLTFSGTVLALTGDMDFSGDIYRPDATGSMVISGGTTALLGGLIELYGQTHATFPGDIFMRTDTDIAAFWDGSGLAWDFYANNGGGGTSAKLRLNSNGITFLDYLDSYPGSPTDRQVLVWDNANTRAEFQDVPGGGEFVSLSTAPLLNATTITVPSVTPINTWAVYGPTGGTGVDDTWTALNTVPTDADWIEIEINMTIGGSGTASTNAQINLYCRPYNQTTGLSSSTAIGECEGYVDSGGNVRNSQVITRKIPVDDRRFELHYTRSNVTSGNSTIFLKLLGWGRNST